MEPKNEPLEPTLRQEPEPRGPAQAAASEAREDEVPQPSEAAGEVPLVERPEVKP